MGRYSGGGTVAATGTGFVHMTAAVQDAASKLVENADVSATAAVVLSKLANVSATDKVLGRSTAGAGAIEEIACTAAGRALIDDANAAAQLTTLGAKANNVSATDKVLGRSTAGAGVIEEIACTAAGRAIIDDANAAAQRTTLGLGTMAVEAAADYLPLAGGTLTGDLKMTGSLKYLILDQASGTVGIKSGMSPYDVVYLLRNGTIGDIYGIVVHNTSSILFPVQAPTASAPTYVIGGLYFDTTLNKLRVGGAAAWETITSV